ncbi:hypothetical protein KJ603_02445 [Patescibacteria group bacterium]|nr:hypothetical protein [Patescibacteria group bacterium]
MIEKSILKKLYIQENKSCVEIGNILKCSDRKVDYWIKKYGIPKRSISEAVYVKHNPKGNPFVVNSPKTINQAILYGIGIGLYWGEGTKSNKHSVRLGNTDPRLIKKFIDFLVNIYEIDTKKLKFGLQIFSDMSPVKAQSFWQKELNVSKGQFQKVIITPSRGEGTYRNKIKHGVLTVHFNNKKLRDIICGDIENI